MFSPMLAILKACEDGDTNLTLATSKASPGTVICNVSAPRWLDDLDKEGSSAFEVLKAVANGGPCRQTRALTSIAASRIPATAHGAFPTTQYGRIETEIETCSVAVFSISDRSRSHIPSSLDCISAVDGIGFRVSNSSIA